MPVVPVVPAFPGQAGPEAGMEAVAGQVAPEAQGPQAAQGLLSIQHLRAELLWEAEEEEAPEEPEEEEEEGMA